MPLCSCGRPDTFQAVRITKRQIMRENTIPAGLSFYTTVCRKAAGGGVAIVAPGRADEAKSPQGAFAGREAWRKQEPDSWASKTSANC